MRRTIGVYTGEAGEAATQAAEDAAANADTAAARAQAAADGANTAATSASDAADAATNAAADARDATIHNRWHDPFLQGITEMGEPSGALERWFNVAAGRLTEPDPTYGGRKLVIDFEGAASVRIRWALRLSKLGLAPGDTITASAFAKSTLASARVRVDFRDESFDIVGSETIGDHVTPTTRTRLHATGTAPSGAVFLGIAFERGTAAIDDVEWDGIAVHKSSLPLGEPILWEQGPNEYRIQRAEDKSEAAIDEIESIRQSNRWHDPFLQGITRVGQESGALRSWANIATVRLSDADMSGARQLIVDWAGGATASTQWLLNAADLGISAGDPVTVSSRMQSSAAGGRMRLGFRDSSGATIGTDTIGSTVSDLSAPTRVSVTAIAPPGTVSINVRFERVLSVSDLHIDGIVITASQTTVVEPVKRGVAPSDVALPIIRGIVRNRPPRPAFPLDITVLVGGMSTPNPVATGAAVSITREYSLSDRVGGTKLVIHDPGTPLVRWDFAPSLDHGPARNVGAWVYMHDPDAVDTITIQIRNASATWSRSAQSQFGGYPFTHGWNYVRLQVHEGVTTSFGQGTDRVSMVVTANSATEIVVGAVWTESADKASIMIVQDGGYYQGFLDSHLVAGQSQGGLQDLIDRDYPIIWALNPARIMDVDAGNPDGSTMSSAQLEELKSSGVSKFSFHSYARESLVGFSVSDLKKEIDKSIDWLMSNGFGQPSFRAAHTGNNAPNASQTIYYRGLHALAASTQNTGGPVSWPFGNRANIRRNGIENDTEGQISGYFDVLEQLRGVSIFYLHKINADGDAPGGIELSRWYHFLSLIDEGVSDGWLEVVCYEDLQQRLLLRGIQDTDQSITEACFEAVRAALSDQ